MPLAFPPSRLLVASAAALRLASGASVARTTTAGADGPQFPSLAPAQDRSLSREQVKEVAEARNATRSLFAPPDDDAGATAPFESMMAGHPDGAPVASHDRVPTRY